MDEQPAHRHVVRTVLPGCLAVVAVVAVALAVLSSFLRAQLAHETTTLQEQLRRDYRDYDAEGRIPEDDRPLFEELHELAQRPETGYFAVAGVLATMQHTLQDGEVSDRERRMLETLRDKLRDAPAPGIAWFIELGERYPELEQALAEYATDPPPGEVNGNDDADHADG